MEHTINHRKQERAKKPRFASMLMLLLTVVILTQTSGYAQDPRIPAADHPLSAALAPAIGRFVNSGCTGWIAQGGILITAGHCDTQPGDMIEFKVPQSGTDGFIKNSSPEDTYEVSEILDENDNGTSDDWAIFKVHDNAITGYQPIVAQKVHIKLVRDLSGSTYRLIGYGVDKQPYNSSNPNGFNSSHKTLQTSTGDNLTTSLTNSLVQYDITNVSGNSGGPVIDESTGFAVGVHTTKSATGAKGRGTSAYRSSFWNAYQAEQTSFTLTVTQKDESGGYLTGSTFSRWDGDDEEFDDFTLSGSSINFGTAWVGNAEIFRGDQGVYNNPKEKFNEWTGFNDVQNHKAFQLQDQLYTSQFKKAQSTITVKNYYPEYPSFTGSGQIEFKDPWLIDYDDPDLNNETRNRGENAVFYTQNSPFTPGFSPVNGKLYNGLFLNENENFLPNLNNYSVRSDDSPITENFGGALGNRKAVFYEWTGVNANFQDPVEEETGVVFTSSTAEARANLKISNVTDTYGSNASTGQRKIVRTANGWLHRVYESMGHVWYETKSPTGNWEIVTSHGSGNNYVDAAGGKSPSIEMVAYDSTPNNPNSVIIAWQEGLNIKMRIYKYYATYNYYTWWYQKTIQSVVTSSSFDVKPTLSYRGEDEFIVLWQDGSGLKFKMFEINLDGIDTVMVGSIPNTDANSKNPAIATDKNVSSNPWYQIAWEQNGSYGASTIQYVSFAKSASGGSYYATYYPSNPITISSSSDFLSKGVSLIYDYFGVTFGWTCKRYSYWDPMSSQGCIRSYDFTNLSSISKLSQSVEKISIAKSVVDTSYYFTWSEKYYYPNSQYNSDRNGYVEKGSFYYMRFTNTTAPYIELYDAPSGSDMQISAFYTSTPKYYTLSNPLEATSKRLFTEPSKGRGLIVSLNETTGVGFEIGSMRVGNETVSFPEVEEIKAESTKRTLTGGSEQRLVKKGLNDVEQYLISDPFEIHQNDEFDFSESISIGDSTSLIKALGKSSFIAFDFELVDDSDSKVLKKIRSVKLNANEIRSKSKEDYKINFDSNIEGKVRLKIAPRSNIEDISYELVTSYYSKPSESEKRNSIDGPTDSDIISNYELGQNYPNPFNPTTQITYQIPEDGKVALDIFDVLGRKVSTLVNEQKSAGKYTATFDGKNLSSGFYIYRIQVNNFVETKKMFLLK